MAKYQVVLIEQTHNFSYGVYENATEEVINEFFFEEDAVKFCRFLNSGGAFDGFTPAFILNKVKVDIDSEFNRLVATAL
jgi:hypothetical protein